MPHGIAPRLLRSRVQTLQRKHVCGRKVAVPVLVMNRERFGGLTPERSRTRLQFQ